MAFEIENGVLTKYTPELSDTDVFIPEGVTTISSNVDFGCRRVVLPDSLKSIEEGCFHQIAAFDGEYNNATLVLYGVEINLSDVFANNISSDWEEAARDSIDDEDMIYDRQRMADAAYEYYNNKEEIIINGVIKEINSILNHEYCNFEFIPYYVLKPIIEAVTKEQEDEKAVSALKASEEKYIKDFDIENRVLKRYNGSDSIIVIPSSVEKLDSICNEHFDSYGNSTVKKIIIPNTVKRVGTQAFAKCRELREIIIKITDNTYISLCDMSFDGCTKLERIVVSDCVPDVWDLSGSGSHNSYYNGAPYSLKAIGYDGKYGVCEIDCSYKNARQKMKAVKSALEMLANKDFETSLAPAVKNAFIAAYYVKTHNLKAAECIKENLEKILPKQIKDGDENFVRSISETKAIIEKNDIPQYIKTAKSANQDVIAAILQKSYDEYDTLPDYPEVFEHIEEDASQVTSAALETDDDPSHFEIIDGVLKKYTGNAISIIIPEGVTAIASGAFGNHNKLSSVIIPEGVKEIMRSAFLDQKDLISVSFPKSLVYVGDWAFKGTKLVEDYPDDLVIVDGILLKYNGNSSDVAIPNYVRAIASAAFDENAAVKSITVPDSVEYIGKYAFLGCNNLTQVIFPKNMFVDMPLFTDPFLNIRASSLTTIKGTIYGDFIDIKGLARKFDATMEMIADGYYEAKISSEVKYPIIIVYFKYMRSNNPNEELEKYISENIVKIMPCAIERADVEFVKIAIEKGMVTKGNIAKFITASRNQPEIKAILEVHKTKL